MEESKVLSPEEVNELIKVSQEKNRDLAQIIKSYSEDKWSESSYTLNDKALHVISELCWAEFESALTSFLRKKIFVKPKITHFTRVSDFLSDKMEKHIYSIFHIVPNNRYVMAVINLPFLHQCINLLCGGHTNAEEPIMEKPGKVGVILAEKLAEQAVESFVKSCKEYGTITCEKVKTVTMTNLISKMSLDERVYAMEWTVMIGDIETTFVLLVSEGFLHEFIPDHTAETSYTEKDSWRSTIESQVVDSNVTIKVSLPDIKMKLTELTALKSGDLIPIGDPTLVYICLNNLKLFRASAGQANANRVVKIISEI